MSRLDEIKEAVDGLAMASAYAHFRTCSPTYHCLNLSSLPREIARLPKIPERYRGEQCFCGLDALGRMVPDE